VVRVEDAENVEELTTTGDVLLLDLHDLGYTAGRVNGLVANLELNLRRTSLHNVSFAYRPAHELFLFSCPKIADLLTDRRLRTSFNKHLARTFREPLDPTRISDGYPQGSVWVAPPLAPFATLVAVRFANAPCRP
jgi:hypothetical protein